MENNQLLEATEKLRQIAQTNFDLKNLQLMNANVVLVFLDEQLARIREQIKQEEENNINAKRKEQEDVEDLPIDSFAWAKEEESVEQEQSVYPKKKSILR